MTSLPIDKNIESRTRVVIMGAAGRDFHNFNVYFRENPRYEVVAFTAEQIPGIANRMYPPILSGPLYPKGVPIRPEVELSALIKTNDVEQAIYALSDTSHVQVMNRASQVLAAGADFRLMGPNTTMIRSVKPIISICAVRTGSGKSQTTRRVAEILSAAGLKVVVIRHPMPYGDLAKQVWQRYETLDDLDKYQCTIEEREEYEPHIARGTIVYAGVDYGKILQLAERDADVILWDGGNNDLPFYVPTLHIVVVDPHRANHEITYHPGETNLRMADVVVINKINTAPPGSVDSVRQNISRVRPGVIVIQAASPVTTTDPEQIRGRDVLVIEDGPTLTHGGMAYGAGTIIAQKHGARNMVDPRPYAVGSIRAVYESYPHLGPILPAMGYGAQQVAELEETINNVPCDLVIIGTPIDITRVTKIRKPTLRVRYELQEHGEPTLAQVLDAIIKKVRKP